MIKESRPLPPGYHVATLDTNGEVRLVPGTALVTTRTGTVFVHQRAFTCAEFEMICHNWLSWYEGQKVQRGPGG